MKNYELRKNRFDVDYIWANDDNGVEYVIPCDPANSDYQRYLRWLENPDADESGTL